MLCAMPCAVLHLNADDGEKLRPCCAPRPVLCCAALSLLLCVLMVRVLVFAVFVCAVCVVDVRALVFAVGVDGTSAGVCVCCGC